MRAAVVRTTAAAAAVTPANGRGLRINRGVAFDFILHAVAGLAFSSFDIARRNGCVSIIRTDVAAFFVFSAASVISVNGF